ncbi:hypothetical protein [Bifidobacterium catulorum]|uniref:Uncharacterized protein n=1 Tax=Bifidobacterium catulorum TaxID=1630173 RepID=A0A2U2MS23_9BIFI|nr:hypothetical protein [Bifidobacterium catulorum]PWG59651.1 hypothetical protein DF200_06310 [Bifidobacterium catulorum]
MRKILRGDPPALVITHLCVKPSAMMSSVLVITHPYVKPGAETFYALVITHSCAKSYAMMAFVLVITQLCVITSTGIPLCWLLRIHRKTQRGGSLLRWL